jgi:hypothetical protein
VVIWYGIDLEEPGDVEWDDKEERTEISRMKTLLTKNLQYKKDVFKKYHYSVTLRNNHKLVLHKGVFINQCFGSGFNQVSGSVSGFGIRIRIQESKKDPQK